ncbi:MAG TPA: RdgB/HAM1 family non-canonical purine NTP pyrophosphatase [Anaerolineales bacterium]|nr:RdgB/HAM1 family non-canonical purine NTP pyrophosphatase [Anaerolineales bacterium]HUS85179.1 RdgB/HAM1 family non-canonical purine NTP pyrophosphatase [Anaerolineales bacterium]
MKQLLLASRNPGKCREMRVLLQPLGVEIIDVIELGTDVRIDEIGMTYAENASLKAGVFAEHFQMWAIGDDTGLEVDALEGSPGLRSARLVGSGSADIDRRNTLLSLLKSHSRPWTARFRCVVALAGPERGIDLAEGVCEGEIIPDERGEGGFGYDPIFLVKGLDQTMAEISPEEKNRVSHRARAIQALFPTLMMRLDV